MKKPTKLDLQIINEITRAAKALGADMELLAAIGSWGDTLTDAEVLMFLKMWNKKHGPRPHGMN